MIKYEITPEITEKAKVQFDELQTQRQLLNERSAGSYSASRLYHFVLGHNDPEIANALKDNLSLRRAYKALLQQSAFFHIPQAIAASSDEYPDRHCDGCRIRLQASRAESSQLYLIIELSDQRREMPKTLTAFFADETNLRLELPLGRNGVIQTMIDAHSDMATLLANPKTELFLR
jgi:hypothetical protein